MLNAGKPNDTSTSTWTGAASIPKTAAVRTQASTPPSLQAAGARAGASKHKEKRRRTAGAVERIAESAAL